MVKNLLFAVVFYLLTYSLSFCQQHELRTGLIQWAVLEPNAGYEFSQEKLGLEVNLNVGKNQVLISDFANRTFESFTQRNLTSTFTYKHYLTESLPGIKPIVSYYGIQLRPRFTLTTEEGYYTSYLEVHNESAPESLISSLPLEAVAGLKSILLKNSRFTLDGRFFTGIDLSPIFSVNNKWKFTAGLGLLVGYQMGY